MERLKRFAFPKIHKEEVCLKYRNDGYKICFLSIHYEYKTTQNLLTPSVSSTSIRRYLAIDFSIPIATNAVISNIEKIFISVERLTYLQNVFKRYVSLNRFPVSEYEDSMMPPTHNTTFLYNKR